ncbi:timeless protein-domain-containing protein [Gloeopeniophorella convolvens]|nr:timeless protein-domain-containing protein [Gloeopeniophorella convolvens]
MAEDDVISISSGDEKQDEYSQRRAILEPAILNVVDALGGYENGVYRLGDEVHGCLKDLKRFWRRDDTDDERTVARIFWACRVLPNDLVPIILETAGKGHVEDKRAIACTDLITAMTWPIDLAEELKELDEELDRGTDYTLLLQSHLHYKAALLRPEVFQALFSIILPCLARSPRTRTERDVQVINVVLHLVRNLAFIKDLPANVHLSADQAEFSTLQSKLIRTLSESNFLDLLLTMASSAASDVMFNNWNTLVLEIFYLLFRGVKPTDLVLEQAAQTKQNLRQLLSLEDQRRRDFARKAPSRHSRFGTTISVTLNPKKAAGTSGVPAEGDAGPAMRSDSPAASSSQPLVLHRQQALSKESGVVIDLLKRQKKQKGKKEDELGRHDNLTPEARTILRGLARTFIESCFNPFLASLLKDIRSERPKVTEKDNLRLLFVTKWFLEHFLAVRAQEKGVGSWAFGLVGAVIERSWIVWVLKRMNGAVEEKPKLWTELQAGIECLTQLLALLEAMASAGASDAAHAELHDAADLLQQQLVYNGQVLDAALDGLRVYKDGTQSLTFLHASVHLAYALMRMLEKWAKAKGDGAYVRKRAKPRRKRRAQTRGAEGPDGVPDMEEEEVPTQEDNDVIEETMFTFESFELKFANSDITHSLLTYLARYKDFSSPEEMKRVVSLLHRQAVRAKAEGLLFQVSTLHLFKSILADQKSFPKDQPYKDLVALINYVLRQFFKAVEADSFVLIEAFFPKTRGQWKKLSSWEPETKSKSAGSAIDDTRFPPDVQVKKGFSWSEQLGIAMAALQEAGQGKLIEWVKEVRRPARNSGRAMTNASVKVLNAVIAQRQRIIEQTDGSGAQDNASDEEDEPLDDEAIKAKLAAKEPSDEALAKITDYAILYINDAQAEAATRNPQLKLMFRLAHFSLQDEDADELEWFIPAGTKLDALRQSLAVIEQFEKSPLDLQGKRAAQLLHKRRRRRRRRAASPGSDADDSDMEAAPRRARKAREKETYKSAQFIEDSDEEFGRDIDDFFAREAALRERTALAAVDSALGIGTMRSTGTKKRRLKPDGARGARTTKRRKGTGTSTPVGSDADEARAEEDRGGEDSDAGSGSGSPAQEHPAAPRARPRPRPRYRGAPGDSPPTSARSPGDPVEQEDDTGDAHDGATGDAAPALASPRASDDEDAREASGAPLGGTHRKARLVVSDEDE